MSTHFRFLGNAADTGLILSLRDNATGIYIEVRKASPGGGLNESNGRLLVRFVSVPGTAPLDYYVSNPGIDVFDGFFYSLALTFGNTFGDCTISIGTIGYAESYLFFDSGNLPPWGSNNFDKFIAGGIDCDLHSIGYKDAIVSSAHSTYHTAWSTLFDVLTYMQNNSYTGAYWCQNEDDND